MPADICWWFGEQAGAAAAAAGAAAACGAGGGTRAAGDAAAPPQRGHGTSLLLLVLFCGVDDAPLMLPFSLIRARCSMLPLRSQSAGLMPVQKAFPQRSWQRSRLYGGPCQAAYQIERADRLPAWHAACWMPEMAEPHITSNDRTLAAPQPACDASLHRAGRWSRTCRTAGRGRPQHWATRCT